MKAQRFKFKKNVIKYFHNIRDVQTKCTLNKINILMRVLGINFKKKLIELKN